MATHEALAVSEMLKPKKKLMLLSHGGHIKLCGSSCSRYTFICSHTLWNQSYPAAEWFLKTLGPNVYLVNADFSSGQEAAKFFRDPFEEKGGKVVGTLFTPLGTTEYAPYLAKIKSATPKPNGIFGFLSGNDLVNFVKQYSEFGLQKENIPIVMAVGGFSPPLLPSMGDACLGHYHIFVHSNWMQNKENEAFMASYKEAFQTAEMDGSVQTGYEVGTLMVKGLDFASGNPEDTEKIIDGIEKTEYRSPRGYVRMDPNHVLNTPVYVFQVQKKNGKLIVEKIADLGNWGTPYSGSDAPGGECKMGR
jgi:branched-chain amino acid transport system substrate-binding protein